MNIPKEWYDRIHKHALDHYNEDGWDYFVECEDLASLQDECDETWPPETQLTYEMVFEMVKEWMGLLNDRRTDIQGEVF